MIKTINILLLAVSFPFVFCMRMKVINTDDAKVKSKAVETAVISQLGNPGEHNGPITTPVLSTGGNHDGLTKQDAIVEYGLNEIINISLDEKTFKDTFSNFELLTEFVSTFIPENFYCLEKKDADKYEKEEEKYYVAITPTDMPSMLSFSSKYMRTPVIIDRHKMRLYLPSINATISKQATVKYYAHFDADLTIYIKNLEISMDLEFKREGDNIKIIVSNPFFAFDVFYSDFTVTKDRTVWSLVSLASGTIKSAVNSSIVTKLQTNLGTSQLQYQLQSVFDNMNFGNLFGINLHKTDATMGFGDLPWFYIKKGKSTFVFPLGFKMVKEQDKTEETKTAVKDPSASKPGSEAAKAETINLDRSVTPADVVKSDIIAKSNSKAHEEIDEFMFAPSDDRYHGTGPMVKAGIITWNSDRQYTNQAAITAFIEENTVSVAII